MAEPEAGPRLDTGFAEAPEVGAWLCEAAASPRVHVSTEAGLDLRQLDLILVSGYRIACVSCLVSLHSMMLANLVRGVSV